MYACGYRRLRPFPLGQWIPPQTADRPRNGGHSWSPAVTHGQPELPADLAKPRNLGVRADVSRAFTRQRAPVRKQYRPPRFPWSAWRAAGALDGIAGTPFESELLALHAVDRWLDNDFSGLHQLAERMLESAGASGEVPAGVGATALRLYQLTGDDEAVFRLEGELSASDEPLDSHATLRRRITPLWTQLVPSRPRDLELDAHFSSELDALLQHPSELARGLGFEMKALLAQRTGDPDEMLSCALQAEQLLVEGSANWFAALQIRAWAEWELGRMADAIRTADDDLDQAYRHADRSAVIMPLVIYALVLRSLDEPEAAATVSGHLPRRLTVLFVAQLVDLDRWLLTALSRPSRCGRWPVRRCRGRRRSRRGRCGPCRAGPRRSSGPLRGSRCGR